jgi:single-stranded-DNA-specific exonuclease
VGREGAVVGHKFVNWRALSSERPGATDALSGIVMANRSFEPLPSLDYGDHGLLHVADVVERAIRAGKRIALYADYDVDGTMSCVSWIWFLRSIGYANYVHYIPCRFKEGYGLNLNAVRHLIEDERADLVVTMDTGITANAEAALCKERGVEFVCTDHHVIQPDKMPDCVILNPKMHPDARYQDLCGCGITFVLLRRLGERLGAPPAVFHDLLALTGMATICDVVPLNGVNHRLARQGVAALARSRRPVLRQLMEAAAASGGIDEKDVGFRLGPRINAVGRLEHADLVVKAFIDEDPADLIAHMEVCNERRKQIQRGIVEEARLAAAAAGDAPLLFLGGDWHPGVVGIAASKIAEEFWRPTFLFQRKDGVGKGSARSIPRFDVTRAMGAGASLFTKFGGHAAAGGFTFPLEAESDLRAALTAYAEDVRRETPALWRSEIAYDCTLPATLASLDLVDALDELKPFGHGFEEPRFLVEADLAGTRFFNDKQTGKPRHTCVHLRGRAGATHKVMFFNEVHADLADARRARFVVTAGRNTYRGEESLVFMGLDYALD